MTMDLPPIPPAVVEFAELKDGEIINFEGTWKDYQVYYVSCPSKEEIEWGLPIYILYNNRTLRYYNPDELIDLETNLLPAAN